MNETMSTMVLGARRSSKPRSSTGNGVVELSTTAASTPPVAFSASVPPRVTPSGTVSGSSAAATRNGISTAIRRSTYRARSRATTARRTSTARYAAYAAQAPGGEVADTTASPSSPTILTRGSNRWIGESPAATCSIPSAEVAP